MLIHKHEFVWNLSNYKNNYLPDIWFIWASTNFFVIWPPTEPVSLEVKSPLIQPLPSIDLSNYSAPLLRKTRQGTNEKTDATQSGIKTYLALLDPYLTYGHGHSGSYSSLYYDPDSDTYSEKDSYPVDSECLWKSWHSNADGQFQCDCKPNLNLGVDILPYDNLHTNIILSNETAISTLSIGDETIWTNSATHLTGLNHYDSDKWWMRRLHIVRKRKLRKPWRRRAWLTQVPHSAWRATQRTDKRLCLVKKR